jgi:hypothetical protein
MRMRNLFSRLEVHGYYHRSVHVIYFIEGRHHVIHKDDQEAFEDACQDDSNDITHFYLSSTPTLEAALLYCREYDDAAQQSAIDYAGEAIWQGASL